MDVSGGVEKTCMQVSTVQYSTVLKRPGISCFRSELSLSRNVTLHVRLYLSTKTTGSSGKLICDCFQFCLEVHVFSIFSTFLQLGFMSVLKTEVGSRKVRACM